MRTLIFLVSGLMCWQVTASAQTTNHNAAALDAPDGGATKNGVVGAASAVNAPTYAPLTASERWRQYFLGAFGPGAILRAAAAGGITQWDGSPKEWKQGSEAFGDRVGNSFAEHVIRTTLESGAAAVLHEDNRYFKSADTGFGKRLKHAVGSVFVARNQAGQEHFAYSRFGAALGTSFISREWQPPSVNSSGDAAVNFGIAMAVDMGWNVFKEFRPNRLRRRQ